MWNGWGFSSVLQSLPGKCKIMTSNLGAKKERKTKDRTRPDQTKLKKNYVGWNKN